MLAAGSDVVVAERLTLAGEVPARPSLAFEVFASSGLERVLVPGELLVRAGERKTHVYRVASGLVCAFRAVPGGGRQALGFSFAGEYVGLGALERHAASVEAVAEGVVHCLPRLAALQLLASDTAFAARDAEAGRQEMELLRQHSIELGGRSAEVRVAALLSALAAINGREGRRGDLIGDDLRCGLVAERLGLDIPALEATLVALARRGLVAAEAGGLRLLDKAALDRLADGP